MRRVTMGIDLGIKAPSVAVLLDEESNILIDGERFELSLEALERLECMALQAAGAESRLHVVIEKTFPSCEYMSGFFRSRGYEVSFAKPDQVKQARKFISPKVKTDRRDAYVLARLPYLDPRQLERVHVVSRTVRELKTLVSRRLSLVRQLTQLKIQLLRVAGTIWPGIAQAFDSLDSAHARAFLREMAPDAVVEMGEDQLAEYLCQQGRITLQIAQRIAHRLLAVSRKAVGLRSLVDEGRWLEIHQSHCQELIQQVESVEGLLKQKEKQTLDCYRQADPEQHLLSVVGVGESLAPTILSYFGEVERFPTTRKAQGFVGFYPETDASGTSDRKATTLSKKGPAPLRRDLFLAADSFRRHDPHGARLYHDQMVNKGKHHYSALCVVANRQLIPRIVAVLREKRPYELRDFENQRINKEQARELIAQFQVTEEDRKRLRSGTNSTAKTQQDGRSTEQSRGSQTPQMTSELDAPRNGRAFRPANPTSEGVHMTKAQLAQFVFREMDRLLNTGGNLEEIRSTLHTEAAIFFEKRVDTR